MIGRRGKRRRKSCQEWARSRPAFCEICAAPSPKRRSRESTRFLGRWKKKQSSALKLRGLCSFLPVNHVALKGGVFERLGVEEEAGFEDVTGDLILGEKGKAPGEACALGAEIQPQQDDGVVLDRGV